MIKIALFLFSICLYFPSAIYAQLLAEPFNYPVDFAKTIDQQSGDVWKTVIPPDPYWNIEKPNIIIVLSDDQGYGDFSVHGNPVLKTPALDRLHNESVRFSNFHVSPLCTPTRGQLLSGLDAMNNKASTVLSGRGIMRRDIITMPEVLKNNGYSTGIFGKWHLGDTYPDRPMDKGFEKCIWIKGWGLFSESEYDNDYYKTRYMDSQEVNFSDQYCTDLWFNKSIEWMEEMYSQKKPFFTYLALNAPHGPFHAKSQDFDRYRSQVSDNSTASFLGMISNIDENMDYLDKWLEKKGLKKNTIVIFMNDNGGTGGTNLYNAGMKGEKGSNYEGGHRAVCFIRWPDGNLGLPRTISYPAQIQDILPTIIDLFNLSNQQSFDGESLKPVLKPVDAEPDNRMFVVQQGNPVKYNGCVVWNSWRLVGQNELYDINTDPGQVNNLISTYPTVANEMKAFYENWWAKLAPDTSPLVHLLIGTDKESPVILTSGSWVGANVNTVAKVAAGEGGGRGGVWYINAEEGGRYKLELSRWPPHLNRKLVIAGPDKSVGGTNLETGVALPIEFGCVSLNNSTPVVVKVESEASSVTIEIDIQAGDNILQAWFKDLNSQDLCGAYYMAVQKI